jgi:hypothetical protein
MAVASGPTLIIRTWSLWTIRMDAVLHRNRVPTADLAAVAGNILFVGGS